MNTSEIEQGYIHHAALSQLHRWYQIYEHPAVMLKNQLEILSPEIKLKSGLGEAKGHEAYKTRIDQLPKTWQNAHFVRNPKILVQADGQILLEASVTYLNLGIRPDASVRCAQLRYHTMLEPSTTLLPRFTRIEIEQLDESTAEQFQMAYPENRLLSLIHRWLALIENPARDPEPVREILATRFELCFSSGTITDFAGFTAWLRGPGSQVRASTHEIADFACTDAGDNQYSAQMDFSWQGILPDDRLATCKTRHRWWVTDQPEERFARIQRLEVEVLEPLVIAE